MRDATYAFAVENADHYIAVGQNDIYLYHDAQIPAELWALVTTSEAGSSYRLNGPSSVQFRAEHPSGLSFRWSVDFEDRDANGSGVHQFDREKIRDLILKLKPAAAKSFASFFEAQVLPPLRERTDELRKAMNKQMDSLDCALGIVEYARQLAEPTP